MNQSSGTEIESGDVIYKVGRAGGSKAWLLIFCPLLLSLTLNVVPMFGSSEPSAIITCAKVGYFLTWIGFMLFLGAVFISNRMTYSVDESALKIKQSIFSWKIKFSQIHSICVMDGSKEIGYKRTYANGMFVVTRVSGRRVYMPMPDCKDAFWDSLNQQYEKHKNNIMN